MKSFYKKIHEEFNPKEHHEVILIRALELLDRAEAARLEIAKDGITVKDRYGSLKAHPAVKIEVDCKSQARLLLRELGMDLVPTGQVGRPSSGR
jgi:phage terminase small subunit